MRVAVASVLGAMAVIGALNLTDPAIIDPPHGQAMAPSTQQTLAVGIAPGEIEKHLYKPQA